MSGKHGRLALVATADLSTRRGLTGLTATVDPLLWSPDGERLWAATSRGELAVWPVADGQLLARVAAHSGRVFDLALSPDGAWAATAGGDHRVGLWRADTLDVDAGVALAEALARFGGTEGEAR